MMTMIMMMITRITMLMQRFSAGLLIFDRPSAMHTVQCASKQTSLWTICEQVAKLGSPLFYILLTVPNWVLVTLSIRSISQSRSTSEIWWRREGSRKNCGISWQFFCAAGRGSSQSHTYVDFMAQLKRSKKDLARTSAVFCIVYNRECSAYGTQCTVHLGHSALQSVRCAKHKAELLQPPEVNPASLHCIILMIIW